MAQTDTQNSVPEATAQVELEGGTYEIIRNRLSQHAIDLRSRLERLNEARKEVFGSIETKLLSTERITTSHNCLPRDMISIGNRFIFGYNVHIGLKTETELSDVFSVYAFHDGSFHEQPLDLITDPRFENDFREIYRYYKNSVFAKFFVNGAHLYMVFRVGKTVSDIKSFKWIVQDDALTYVDNRSDHEVRFPAQHEFEWTRTTRDQHLHGEFPHISIENRVFVETVGGDLTIKIENNTDSGEGIYAEDVEDTDQTLDDAQIYYAMVGNIILLKIRPYQEKDFRYIVYNEKIQQAMRIDSVAQSCVLLPDDHGLIFPHGYYLQDGEYKTFASDVTDLLFERRISAPNGEDFLYLFYNRESGDTVLLRYNLIEQRVDTPMICNGATFFEAGELICFKRQEQPQKHHTLQLWQTPYVADDYVPETNTDSLLYKIGNRDIVRGMAECHEVLKLIEKEDTYANLYVDMVKESGDIIDSYFWIDDPHTFNLKETLVEIRGAAASAVDEFDKVVRVKRNTAEQTTRVADQTRDIVAQIHHQRFDNINDFVQSLSRLRSVRGDVISLRDLRYVDGELVDSLDHEVADHSETLARRCVAFLLKPDALLPYATKIDAARDHIQTLNKVSDAKKLEEEIAAGAGELEMLIEIVSNLKIDDATQRTAIIDNISAIFAKVNQARAALKARSKELMSVEGVAEFNSQMKLLNQAVVNYLDICETPERCEEFLTKLMIQLEELEGRFAEFDEFIVQLSEKRDEVYNAFETRKLALIEARNKRATALMSAAERILKGIHTRVSSLESVEDIRGYFASDLMIEKVRDIVERLKELDDSVKVDDVQGRMKTIREDAVRQLKDRQDLFSDGGNRIQLGTHQFSVNVQALDLTTVNRDGRMGLHLTGTNFFQDLDDAELLSCHDVWDQEVVSENRDLYRAEYLAYCMLRDPQGRGEDSADAMMRWDDETLTSHVQKFMGPRYGESYVKGVHDHDAAKIFRALLEMRATIGRLRFDTRARALAATFWAHFGDVQAKSLAQARLEGFGTVARLFPDTEAQTQTVAELRDMLAGFVEATGLFPAVFLDEAADYLFDELIEGGGLTISRTACDAYDALHRKLKSAGHTDRFAASLKSVQGDPRSSFLLARDWARAFLAQHASGTEHAGDAMDYADEVATLLIQETIDRGNIVEGHVVRELTEMVGSHAVIDGGRYHLNYNHFIAKLAEYDRNVVPQFRRFVARKRDLVETAREQIRLEEFRPRVLTSFVRNKLIDEVYLPLIGDNLAKQIGVAGEQKRTDLMGLLLLVSPPGYGKTTLMEYLANRLGVIFMKINGPAIGHRVTSLDPAEAPNAGAREEVEKLNLSFEMGDNVMIYLDDIQHCNPEFLQKFISLCDAQRKVEGVYQGKSRTYDLRGRKVVVVMAGNPYTESGQRFQIPDMLSNRADVYNLGEMIGDSAEVFEMSYLENALTSNPVLNQLASRSQDDVYAVIRMAQRDVSEGIELEGNYSMEELNELVNTMKKLMRVRDVILAVNREYIRSAAQADEYRTEPPFRLQGSYRNMNRIAEKVVPIMNDAELELLILSNYENDAQTLTSDSEANMLKFKEIMGILTSDEADRWASIQRAFVQNVKLRGVGSDDKAGQMIVQLSAFSEGLEAIRLAMTEGMARLVEQSEEADRADEQIGDLSAQIGGVTTGLESIGRELARGMQQMLELSEKTVAAAPELTAHRGGIAPEQLKSLVSELQAMAQLPTARDPNGGLQNIIVRHKVPRVVLDVVKSQFNLMQSWMAPILSASNLQAAEIQSLQESVDTCLNRYAALVKDLEVAAKKRVAPKNPST